jgi:LacI family transcriptional regulator
VHYSCAVAGKKPVRQRQAAERKRAPTIVDVARLAGVSPATASRAFNGSERQVKEANLQRVLAAARQLDYVPNASAQTVRRGDTRTVALLISDVTDPYFAWMAAGVIERAAEAGLNVTVAVTNRDAQKELELVRLFRAQRPRVIVLGGSRYQSPATLRELRDELQAYEADGGRIVDVSQSGMPFDSVSLGNAEGARELAHRLVGIGYRAFAIIAGPDEPGAAEDRVRGFSAGLRELGVPLDGDGIVRTSFNWDGGHAAVRSLALDRVELIFAVNDMIALGALAGLREQGLAVPEDVALAGYDDIAPLRDVTPSLTSVRIPLKDVGAEAVSVGLSVRQATQVRSSVIPEVLLRSRTPPR